MNKKTYLLVLLVGLLQFISCKKDAPQQNSQHQTQVSPLEGGVQSVSIKGQLFNTVIDTQKNVITIIVPHTLNVHSLAVNFTLGPSVNATIAGSDVSSGVQIDFSKLVYLTVTSADKKRSTTFLLDVQTDLYYYGLNGTLLAEKSLNRDYKFYFDQFDGSASQAVNCGPTVSTMAIKWADSTFTKTPADARNTYEPGGGWWSTRNVTDYLTGNGINFTTDTISNLDSLVQVNINANKVLILCLDMFYVEYNNIPYQHLNKFYTTNAAGWGHFILIKGYKQMSDGFYLEVYDPYSQGMQYYPSVIAHEPMGEDRFYLDMDIKKATDMWNPYAYIVYPKGQGAQAAQLTINSTRIHKPVPVAFGQ